MMSIYDNPLYFDIAFQYRDIGKECDFIESIMELYSKSDNTNILDINCGTGRHLNEMIQRGYEVDGFDESPEMIKFIEKNYNLTRTESNLWTDKLSSFSTEKEYGMLINMLTSFNYISTNKDVINHLESAAKALEHGGLYLMELNHPRDLLGDKTSAPNKWLETRDNIEVEVDWDYKNAPLDFIEQIYTVNGTLTVNTNGNSEVLVTKEKIRIFLFQEIKALIELSGWFELIGSYGAFYLDQKLDNTSNSWRMILILRKQ
ncbi:MAG: methyltransferase domain-containing protein [Acidobacteria bacterium]|nr:methyltransferase domain-containing protein [Acidobacteriota bacterium]